MLVTAGLGHSDGRAGSMQTSCISGLPGKGCHQQGSCGAGGGDLVFSAGAAASLSSTHVEKYFVKAAPG